MKTVTDGDGQEWTVWGVVPRVTEGIGVRTEYARGWLAFRCGTETLRFTPLPDRWEALPASELLACLAEAHQPLKGARLPMRTHGLPRA